MEQLSHTIFQSLIANTHIAAPGFSVWGLASALNLNPWCYLYSMFEQNWSCRWTEHHQVMATDSVRIELSTGAVILGLASTTCPCNQGHGVLALLPWKILHKVNKAQANFINQYCTWTLGKIYFCSLLVHGISVRHVWGINHWFNDQDQGPGSICWIIISLSCFQETYSQFDEQLEKTYLSQEHFSDFHPISAVRRCQQCLQLIPTPSQQVTVKIKTI